MGGLTKAEWAPDGRTILCFSEWGVRQFSIGFVRTLSNSATSHIMVSRDDISHLHPIPYPS